MEQFDPLGLQVMIIVMSFFSIKHQKIIETTNPNLPERKVMQAFFLSK